jgi:polyisoprenoid-binding protein YceI
MSLRKFPAALIALSLLPLLIFLTLPASAAERSIDPVASTLTVKVTKTGLFSAFAHNHEIAAPITAGTVREGDNASVTFRVNARGMKVLDPDASASTRVEVEKNMLSTQVLDTQQYPEITFESTRVQSDKTGVYVVSGNLTLHGQSHPVQVNVKQAGTSKYEGSAKLKQTTFGIQPISIGGGAVKVKDEVEIVFTIALQ